MCVAKLCVSVIPYDYTKESFDIIAQRAATSSCGRLAGKFSAYANMTGGTNAKTMWKAAWDHPPIGYPPKSHPASAKMTISFEKDAKSPLCRIGIANNKIDIAIRFWFRFGTTFSKNRRYMHSALKRAFTKKKSNRPLEAYERQAQQK